MRSLTLAAILLVATGAAVAQPPTFVIGGVSEPVAPLYGRLVTSKVLADELKLTDDQKAKLKATLEPFQKAEREASKQPRRAESRDEYQEREAATAKRQAEMKAAVAGVLTPEQVRRLTQIAYQHHGWAAFLFQEVRDGVKMTPEQVEAFVAVMQERHTRQSEILKNSRAPGNVKETREETRKRLAEEQEKLAAIDKKTLGKIVAALTDEQKTAWKAMTGPPFDRAKFRDETAPPKPKDK